MKKIYIIIGLLVCGCTQLGMAQDLAAFQSAFAKSAAYYKTLDAYALAMKYGFYEDEDQKMPDERLGGTVIKANGNYYSKIDQTEFVYVDQEFVKINHQEKAVLYGVMGSQKQPVAPIQITQILGLCKDAEMTKSTDKLIFDVVLHAQFGLPYNRMRFELNAETYAIVQQEIYLAAGQPYPWQALRTKVSETPSKMVITLTETPTGDAPDTLFQLSNYIRKGKEISLSKKLTAYTLYDATK